MTELDRPGLNLHLDARVKAVQDLSDARMFRRTRKPGREFGCGGEDELADVGVDVRRREN